MSVATGNVLTLVALGLVVLALLAGLVNMMRDGSTNLSQRFMRWRVGLQFLTVLVVVVVLYFRR